MFFDKQVKLSQSYLSYLLFYFTIYLFYDFLNVHLQNVTKHWKNTSCPSDACAYRQINTKPSCWLYNIWMAVSGETGLFPPLVL